MREGDAGLSVDLLKGRIGEVTIAGHNFLSSDPGQVDFVFDAVRYRAVIGAGDWQDDAVEAEWPSTVVEADPMDGFVEVTNHLGLRATHPIRYAPQMVTVELEYVQWGAVCDSDDTIAYTANSRLHPLRNGWRVVRSSLTTLNPAGSTSYYGEERSAPVIGSDDPRHGIGVHCRTERDGQACVSIVVIEGPEGLPYE